MEPAPRPLTLFPPGSGADADGMLLVSGCRADDAPSVSDYLDVLVAAARAHLPAEAEIIVEPGAAWSTRPR